MSVYVDKLVRVPSNPPEWWPYAFACHMLADSVDELHAFAERIGLRREWYQAKSTPHYDLTPGMRLRAVAAGAIEISRIEVVAIVRRMRNALDTDEGF